MLNELKIKEKIASVLIRNKAPLWYEGVDAIDQIYELFLPVLNYIDECNLTGNGWPKDIKKAFDQLNGD